MATVNSSTASQSTDGLERTFKIVQLVSLVVYCVVFILGTLGNGLVIYVTGFRMKRTVNSVWFLNLALADFLFTALLIFSIVSLSQDHQWQFGWLMCKVCIFVGVVNMFASIFLLTAISVDRCLSIWVVVWAQNKRTVRKAQIISAVIWVCAVVCSTPYASIREIQQINGRTYCGFSPGLAPQTIKIFTIFRFVAGFVVPFLVILGSYVAIGVRARRLQRTKKKRSFRIIFSIILAFFICWLPFHVLQFVKPSQAVRIAGTLTMSLAFMNSCLNPILYVFMCDEFQKKLKQSICLVLESALAEDHLTRSLSSHFSRISRKSDSAAPLEGKDTSTPLHFQDGKVITEEQETQSSD